MGPEGKVKKSVKKLLDFYRETYKVHIYSVWPVPAGYGESTVDMLACVEGRFLAVETKARGKKPTPRQALTLAQVANAGGFSLVVDGTLGLYTLQHWIESTLNAAGISTPEHFIPPTTPSGHD